MCIRDRDYGFNKEVITRFLKTTEFLQNKFKIDTSVYVKPNDLKKAEIKELVKPNDTATKPVSYTHLTLPTSDLV